MHKIALDAFVFDSLSTSTECWLSASYLSCAASCSSYFLFRACECPGTFYYCEWYDDKDSNNQTLRDRPGIPKFVSDDGGFILSRSTYPDVVPTNWTCHPSSYGTNDGWCNCRCGTWDPDCDDNTSLVSYCNEGTTCEKTSDGYGVCSDDDYEEDYHHGDGYPDEEYANGFPPWQWHWRYAHNTKEFFESSVLNLGYPDRLMWEGATSGGGFNPHEGLGQHDVALDPSFFFTVQLFWVSTLLIASLFSLATGLFLRHVGPSAALDGAYVRFCLRLEHGKFFRRCVMFGCVYTCIVCVCMFILNPFTFEFYFGVPPNEYLIELLFVFISLRAMLLTDSDFALDVDDPSFDDVRFRFFPLFWHGCDEAIQDLTSAVARREIDEGEYYRRKIRKYVRSGGESLRLVQAPPQPST